MSKDYACIPITHDHQVGHGWGKAPTVAIAEIESGAILSWRVEEVGWDVLHDSGEGNHHARVVRFIRDNAVTLVVAQHMGEPMQNMLTKLGVRVALGAAGDARTAVLGFAATDGERSSPIA